MILFSNQTVKKKRSDRSERRKRGSDSESKMRLASDRNKSAKNNYSKSRWHFAFEGIVCGIKSSGCKLRPNSHGNVFKIDRNPKKSWESFR